MDRWLHLRPAEVHVKPMFFPRSLSMLASVAAVLSLVVGAGCTAGSNGSTSRSGTNADCQSVGSNGIATYSLGGPCRVTGPAITGSIQISAHVQVNPHRELTLQVADASAALYGSYDSCSCAPDTTTSTQNGPNYGSYRPCDPSKESNDPNATGCSTTFDNTLTGTVNATNDGTITLQLMDGDTVLEQFSFDVATPASIDVKATSGAAGTPAVAPDASDVYHVNLSDKTVVLTPHLLAADGRALVVGGGRAGLSARFSDSRVLAIDPTVPAGQLGIHLTGAGDATVTLTDGAQLSRVLKFHVAG